MSIHPIFNYLMQIVELVSIMIYQILEKKSIDLPTNIAIR